MTKIPLQMQRTGYVLQIVPEITERNEGMIKKISAFTQKKKKYSEQNEALKNFGVHYHTLPVSFSPYPYFLPHQMQIERCLPLSIINKK